MKKLLQNICQTDAPLTIAWYALSIPNPMAKDVLSASNHFCESNYRAAIKAIQTCCDVLIQIPADSTGQVDRISESDFYLVMLGAFNRVSLPAITSKPQVLIVNNYVFTTGADDPFSKTCISLIPKGCIETTSAKRHLEKWKEDPTRFDSVFAIAFFLLEKTLATEATQTKELLHQLKTKNPNLQIIIVYSTLPTVGMINFLIDTLRPNHISLSLTHRDQTLAPNISHYFYPIAYLGEFYETLWKIQKFSILFFKESEAFVLLKSRGLPVVVCHEHTRPPENQHVIVTDGMIGPFCEEFKNTKSRPAIHCDLSTPGNYARRLKFEGARVSIIFGIEGDIMKVRILEKIFGITVETVDEEKLLDVVASLRQVDQELL